MSLDLYHRVRSPAHGSSKSTRLTSSSSKVPWLRWSALPSTKALATHLLTLPGACLSVRLLMPRLWLVWRLFRLAAGLLACAAQLLKVLIWLIPSLPHSQLFSPFPQPLLRPNTDPHCNLISFTLFLCPTMPGRTICLIIFYFFGSKK